MLTLGLPRGTPLGVGLCVLPSEEAHHVRVRRARGGDPVRILNGQGGVGIGHLAEDRVRAHVTEVLEIPRPAPLVLAVGAGDRERFSWLVEKGTELGVTDFIPLESERALGVSARVRPEHIEKLERRAEEAMKQCGRAWAPTVHLPHSIAELLARRLETVRWLADPDGVVPGPPVAEAAVAIAVGPEGGWTPAERALLVDGGYHPVRFAAHVLRFETAAAAGAVLAALHRQGTRYA